MRAPDCRRLTGKPGDAGPANGLCQRYDPASGTLVYRTRMHATLKRSDQLLPGAQWVERACGHIPDRSEHLVHDDGYYSS